MSFVSRFKQRREELGLTQVQLSKLLGVTKGAIGNYESGVSSPKADILYRVFDVLQCDANYLFQDEMTEYNQEQQATPSEMQKIKKYRALDEHGKEMVDVVLDGEYKRLYPSTRVDKSEQPTIEIIFIDNALASAGIGEIMGDIDQEKISVPETPTTRRADFAIRVRGDSMEPEYYDDDIVLVRKTDYVDKGDIGIFVVDGETYIKKCGGDRLISLNPKYPDITGDEETRIYTMGEVIGKL